MITKRRGLGSYPISHKGSRAPYYVRLKELFGSSLVGYWPLWEQAGTVAVDLSGNGRNGVYTDLTPGIGASLNGKPCPTWSGTQGFIDLLSQSAFINRDEGAFCCYIKGIDYSTASQRRIFYYLVDGTNYFTLLKSGAYTLQAIFDGQNDFQGTSTYILHDGWFHVGMTWSVSNNRCRLFLNAVQAGSEFTNTPLLGAAAQIKIGSGSASAYLLGNGVEAILLNREITPAEILIAMKQTIFPVRTMSILGDSISGIQVTYSWPLRVCGGNIIEMLREINHAAGGASIIANMDAQVVAAASDNADIIICNLGANDNNAGDMGVLQAEVEENLVELKISNPNATIYYMNVLKLWADAIGGPEVPKGNIRTAISAACVAQGISCWDPYTVPWRTQSQTIDGVHSTEAGQAAITAQVLARI